MKLKQDQIWNLGDEFVLITRLERLEVQYKTFKNIANRKGAHHHVSKKEFCKLIKHAILLSPEEVRNARMQAPVAEPMPDATGAAEVTEQAPPAKNETD